MCVCVCVCAGHDRVHLKRVIWNQILPHITSARGVGEAAIVITIGDDGRVWAICIESVCCKEQKESNDGRYTIWRNNRIPKCT